MAVEQMTTEQMSMLETAFQGSTPYNREIILHILLDTMSAEEIENGLHSRLNSDTPSNFDLNIGTLAKVVSHYKESNLVQINEIHAECPNCETKIDIQSDKTLYI